MKKIDTAKLREKLAARFAAATKKAQATANRRLRKRLTACKREEEAVRHVFEGLAAITEKFLLNEGRKVVLTSTFFDELGIALSFRVNEPCEVWFAREDVSEAELRAHAKAIEAGNLQALEKLRDPSRTEACACMETTATENYKGMLANLRYAALMLAHVAKRCDIRETGFRLLRMTSILDRFCEEESPEVSLEDAGFIVDEFRECMQAIQIALDYEALEDWEDFRTRVIGLAAKHFAEGKK